MGTALGAVLGLAVAVTVKGETAGLVVQVTVTEKVKDTVGATVTAAKATAAVREVVAVMAMGRATDMPGEDLPNTSARFFTCTS
jgi:hypothetical protein